MNDFNYNWYNIVGVKMITTCFINIFIPHLLELVKAIVKYYLRNK